MTPEAAVGALTATTSDITALRDELVAELLPRLGRNLDPFEPVEDLDEGVKFVQWLSRDIRAATQALALGPAGLPGAARHLQEADSRIAGLALRVGDRDALTRLHVTVRSVAGALSV